MAETVSEQIVEIKSDRYVNCIGTWRHEATGRFLTNTEAYIMDALYKRDSRIARLQADNTKLIKAMIETDNLGAVVDAVRYYFASNAEEWDSGKRPKGIRGELWDALKAYDAAPSDRVIKVARDWKKWRSGPGQMPLKQAEESLFISLKLHDGQLTVPAISEQKEG